MYCAEIDEARHLFDSTRRSSSWSPIGHRASGSPWIRVDLKNTASAADLHIYRPTSPAQTPQTPRSRLYGSEGWGFESLQAHLTQVSDLQVSSEPTATYLVRVQVADLACWSVTDMARARLPCAAPWLSVESAVAMSLSQGSAIADFGPITKGDQPSVSQREPFAQRMLIARAITRAARARDTIDSTTIISLAQTRTADTSVGLNASAVLNDRTR